MTLAIFDLDHTLLDGDSDVLWCEFLLEHGLLERASFAPQNRRMAEQYQAGTVSAAEFCAFYVSTLAGRSPAEWLPWRERFLHEVVAPRIPAAARALVERHRADGHTLLLSTATNRVLTELTAAQLGIPHLLATECEVGADGRFSGRPAGVLNMREGKVTRLLAWLAERAMSPATLADAHFYSDSANDLPLLQAVGHPVAVNADARLARIAAARGWPVLKTVGR